MQIAVAQTVIVLRESLLDRLIRLFCALFLQILLVRIAARAGLPLLVGGDAAFVGTFLPLGLGFLAAG